MMSLISEAAKTDTNGFYELAGLPLGSLMASVSLNPWESLATKTITLTSGDPVEVNFGNEEGCTLTGIVRRGLTPLEGMTIRVSRSDGYAKSTVADRDGRFQLRGVPVGRTRLTIRRPSPQEPLRAPMPSPEQQRILEVKDDMELDIDLGAGVIAGVLPASLKGREDLRIRPQQEIGDIWLDNQELGRRWVSASHAETTIDSDGTFEIRQLPAGRYYLVLSDEQHVLGITDVLHLEDSGQIRDARFRMGQGRLDITIVDSETGQGIGGACFFVFNDLDCGFHDGRFVSSPQSFYMAADGEGHDLYEDLPPGRYQVSGLAPGYLFSASGFAEVRSTGTTRITLSLNPAAMATFSLSESLRNRFTTDSVMIEWRATDLNADIVVPFEIGYYTRQAHELSLSLDKPNEGLWTSLRLPAGCYRIDYASRPLDTMKGVIERSIHEGTVTAELTTGQTETIPLDNWRPRPLGIR